MSSPPQQKFSCVLLTTTATINGVLQNRYAQVDTPNYGEDAGHYARIWELCAAIAQLIVTAMVAGATGITIHARCDGFSANTSSDFCSLNVLASYISVIPGGIGAIGALFFAGVALKSDTFENKSWDEAFVCALTWIGVLVPSIILIVAAAKDAGLS